MTTEEEIQRHVDLARLTFEHFGFGVIWTDVEWAIGDTMTMNVLGTSVLSTARVTGPATIEDWNAQRAFQETIGDPKMSVPPITAFLYRIEVVPD